MASSDATGAAAGVTSFGTGLAVLGAFDLQAPRLTLAEIAGRCGISRFAARRYLATLVDLGYLGNERKEYFLTHRVLRLGAVFLGSSELVYRVQPVLHRLTAETGENAYLWVRDGHETQVVAKATTNRITNRSHGVGAHFPLFVCSGGLSIAAALPSPDVQVLLDRYLRKRRAADGDGGESGARSRIEAALAQARERGYAISEGQLDDNVRGVAVPLYGARSELLGAISVNMFIGAETSMHAEQRVLRSLRRAAAAAFA